MFDAIKEKPFALLLLKTIAEQDETSTTDLALKLDRTLQSIMRSLDELVSLGYVVKKEGKGTQKLYSIVDKTICDLINTKDFADMLTRTKQRLHYYPKHIETDLEMELKIWFATNDTLTRQDFIRILRGERIW